MAINLSSSFRYLLNTIIKLVIEYINIAMNWGKLVITFMYDYFLSIVMLLIIVRVKMIMEIPSFCNAIKKEHKTYQFDLFNSYK